MQKNFHNRRKTRRDKKRPSTLFVSSEMAFASGRRSLRIRKRLHLLDTPVLRRRKERIYKGGSLQR